MSTTHGKRPGGPLASYPEYDLSYRFDSDGGTQTDDAAPPGGDVEAPARLTVFAGDTVGETRTEWLTVDADVAVPLRDVR